ncbi:MAG: SDR family NAD(P)-dependent oxidoreductase [Burkholderiaceae bacterium]
MRFDGRAVLVTGGANGIGLACATRFAGEGATVAIADRNRDAGERAAARIGARFFATDVANKREVDATVAAFAGQVGRIDVLINNAGITHAAEFLDLAEADFDRVLAINLKSCFLVGQAIAKHMVARRADRGADAADARETGCIINMSSVNAILAIPNQVPYVVSKGGIAQLTKVMALSLAPYGIRVNAIGPGTIATELAKNAVLSDDAARHRVLSRTPLRRLGEPEEVAGIAAFLASADASYLTGQTIYPDGGRLALNYTVDVAGE